MASQFWTRVGGGGADTEFLSIGRSLFLSRKVFSCSRRLLIDGIVAFLRPISLFALPIIPASCRKLLLIAVECDSPTKKRGKQRITVYHSDLPK